MNIINTKGLLIAAVLGIALNGSFSDRAQAGENGIVGSFSEEESKKIGVFGRGVGQAFVCVSDEDRQEMRENIRLIYNFVAQDMGTDAAFLYAVGVGYGGRKELGSVDCDTVTGKWNLALEKFGIIGGEK